MDCFGFVLFGTLWISWICMSVSFPRLEKFSAIICSNKFSPFFSSLFFWETYEWMFIHLISHKLKLSSLFKNSFCFLFCSDWVSSSALSSYSLTLSSALTSLLLSTFSLLFKKFSYCILDSDFCLELSISFFFVEVLILFIHSSPNFSEQFYDHTLNSLWSKLLISIPLGFCFIFGFVFRFSLLFCV